MADDFRLRQQYLGGQHSRYAQLIDQPGTVRLPSLMAHALRVQTDEPNRGQQGLARNVRPRVDGSSRPSQSVSAPPAAAPAGQSSGVTGSEKVWCRYCQKPHPES